jgi:hypothetical protein
VRRRVPLEVWIFIAVMCTQYITLWAASSVPALQISLSPPTPPANYTETVTSGTTTTVVVNHKEVSSFASRLLSENVVVDLLESIPVFGFAYGEYMQVKIGGFVNYEVALLNADHIPVTSLALIGLLFRYAFFPVESAAFALGCAAGFEFLRKDIKKRRKLTGYAFMLGLSIILLFISGYLEALRVTW